MVSTENVAVLFTDVVGSTELTQRLSAEDADEVRRGHFAVLRQAIAQAGGTEVKNLGDGVMVVFASASAALGCAVAIQQGVEQANRRDAEAIGLRVGLSMGEVSREEGDYFGDPVVEAARLCALCESGQVLATDVLRVIAGRRSRIECSPVGELELKGLSNPVETVEVLWEPAGNLEGGAIPLPGGLAVRPAEESVLPSGSEASRGPIRYASSQGRNLAYQVVGGGAADLVISSYGSVSIDSIWDEPRFAGFVTRLSRSSRVILYDTRGIGLSDPIDIGSPPSLDAQAEDIFAVLDAARSPGAVLMGVGDGGPVVIMATHRHPSRVSGLVLINTFARLTYAADYPAGIDPDRLADAISSSTDPASERDTSLVLRNHAPSVAGDPVFRGWWERAGRRGASPATANSLWRVRYGADVRPALPSISVPSLVLHRRNNRLIPFAHGAYLANHLANAQLVGLEGSDQPPFTETPDRIVDEVNQFLAGCR